MIGEAAVHLEKQLDDFYIQALQKLVDHGTGGAVAGVEHYFDAASEFELR